MRSEISNELLLQVIQAWDPDEADKWRIHRGELRHGRWFIRGSSGGISHHVIEREWHEPCELVEFLLKDRPDLKLCYGRCPTETKEKSLDSFDAFWDSDPWGPRIPPISVVKRIKSYEYLREWKESQGTLTAKNIADGFKRQREALQPLICGQAIEGMEICDDVTSGNPYERFKNSRVPPPEVPATYETICPHCNGTKEVTGWSGKESCNAC